jgi:hypothetical protein
MKKEELFKKTDEVIAETKSVILTIFNALN